MNKLIFIIIINIYYLGFTLKAQEKVNTNRKNDSIKIKNFINQYYQNKSESTFHTYSEKDLIKYLELAKRLKINDFEKQITSILAVFYLNKGGVSNYHKSLAYSTECLKLARVSKDYQSQFNSRISLSNVYRRMNNYPEALKNVYESIEIDKKIKNPEVPRNKALSYGTLGNIYTRLKFLDSAISNFEKSRKIFYKLDSNYYLGCSNNIGNIYLEKKDYERAYINFKIAFEGYLKKKDSFHLAMISENLGTVLFEKNDHKGAEKYYKLSINISEKINFIRQKIRSSILLIDTYEKYGKLKKALSLIEDINALVDSVGTLKEKYEFINRKAKVVGNKNVPKTLEYLKLANQLRDSLNELENIPKTTEILLEEETRKQEALEENFFNKITKKNKVLITLSLVILVLSLSIYLIFYKYKSKFNFLRKSKTSLETKLQASNQQKDYLYRQMTTATANLAIKNDILQHLSTTLTRIKEQNKSNEVQKNLENAQYLIRDNLELSKTWDDFFMHFEEVHHIF